MFSLKGTWGGEFEKYLEASFQGKEKVSGGEDKFESIF